MRVIAGSAKGRRLKAVPGLSTRPTADRVKEALFSVLLSRFDLAGSTLLDLFAGTGSIGIEALSRGAERVVFVEQGSSALRVLRANLAACGFADRAEVVPLPVFRALRELGLRQQRRWDGIFADPPFGQALVPRTLAEIAGAGIVEPGGWVMVEAEAGEELADQYGGLHLTRTRSYGKSSLALYENLADRDRRAAGE